MVAMVNNSFRLMMSFGLGLILVQVFVMLIILLPPCISGALRTLS